MDCHARTNERRGHERTAPHERTGSPPLNGTNVGAVRLTVGGGDAHGAHAPVNVGGRAAAVVLTGVDPLDLTGAEVGAGNE